MMFGLPLGKSRFRALVLLCLLVAFAGGCTYLGVRELDERYGLETVRERKVFDRSVANSLISYQRQIKPILDRRCVVCHGCYDAPCQLKLSTFEGIDRGATKEEVYDGARISSLLPTRLYIDARKTEEWRELGFSPVLNERTQTSAANIEAGLIARFLALKARHPLPLSKLWPDSMEFTSSRIPLCPRIEEMSDFESDHPLWGMPYALPPIPSNELEILKMWLVQGARDDSVFTTDFADSGAIEKWEKFLNGSSNKEQLMSRYIFEHIFLAEITLGAGDGSHRYRLVRSKSPPGVVIDEIATRRPYDDPTSPVVYYRLKRILEAKLVKTSMPYSLTDAKLDRFRELFLVPEYEVNSLPAYDTDQAPNPFETFAAIPYASKYQFMLDDAQFIIMSFIKGPVCKGNLAVNVIRDRFWILFFDPKHDPVGADSEFQSLERESFNLPSGAEMAAPGLLQWILISRKEREYFLAKSEFLATRLDKLNKLTIDYIWQGDGKNTNAALTVFRHYDSATVVRGLVGDVPQTAWVLNYPLFERIHYLLVAGFDVFGHAGHQVTTRLYMDFLRMEAEQNFLAFLPSSIRKKSLLEWYRGMDPQEEHALFMLTDRSLGNPSIAYVSKSPKEEFFELVKSRLSGVLSTSNLLHYDDLEPIINLSRLEGLPVSWLSEVSLLLVRLQNGEERYFSIFADRSLQNVSALFYEEARRVPKEDRITIIPGIVGGYPNTLFVVTESELPDFVARVSRLDGRRSYERLMDTYGVRRTDQQFWSKADRFQDKAVSQTGAESGLLDVSRLENR